MATRYDIVTYGAKVLRRKADPIDRITDDIRDLANDMLNAMHRVKGVGLASQQIGKSIALCVIDIPPRPDADGGEPLPLATTPVDMPLIMINPRITEKSGAVTEQEGCLSFPEIYADISRPEQVEVTALNEHGKPVAFRCGGLLARAIQHELDHLNGILFIDRMELAKKRELKPELDALQSETKESLRPAKV